MNLDRPVRPPAESKGQPSLNLDRPTRPPFIDFRHPPSRTHDLAEGTPTAPDSLANDSPAEHQIIHSDAATLTLDRPRKVKVEPASPPLSHSLPPPYLDLNLDRPSVRQPTSKTNPAGVIDLTRSPPAKAGSGPSLTTLPTSINLDRPLRKAKSAQSYAGLPPCEPLLTAERVTHSSVEQEMTQHEWADDRLSFPRTKVGDPLHHTFGN
ncbi:uncharacterized protein LACBIDRAFT_336052 [Laccaria bicolor S238N-H82]|nr:uncharacterized protein LACBIDRAFT_336052 [Laccaria bicolor S238N-H82]EDQ98341.1 predicted protein [Laccaria bicolor S238N-H82]|eukprot:XP_001891006.1 predicted protein [Laccaria bicolor S238N-H82]